MLDSGASGSSNRSFGFPTRAPEVCQRPAADAIAACYRGDGIGEGLRLGAYRWVETSPRGSRGNVCPTSGSGDQIFALSGLYERYLVCLLGTQAYGWITPLLRTARVSAQGSSKGRGPRETGCPCTFDIRLYQPRSHTGRLILYDWDPSMDSMDRIRMEQSVRALSPLGVTCHPCSRVSITMYSVHIPKYRDNWSSSCSSRCKVEQTGLDLARTRYLMPARPCTLSHRDTPNNVSMGERRSHKRPR